MTKEKLHLNSQKKAIILSLQQRAIILKAVRQFQSQHVPGTQVTMELGMMKATMIPEKEGTFVQM